MKSLVSTCRAAARPLEGTPRDLDAVLDVVGQARIVLIGEASHGTHEFYRVRAEITKRLIREAGFTAVAVEADWPDAYRVNRYVRALGDDTDAAEALEGFERFPQWMWRNADVLDFAGWLRDWNEAREPAARAGFYGLDLYSLHRSMGAVLEYLRIVDPEAARRAQERYACFDGFGEDPQSYGYAATLGLSPSCERDVVAQLVEMQRFAADYARRDGRLDPDHQFFAEQNARLVVDAEKYYRSMFGSRASSWNLRDRHMMSVLESIDEHLTRRAGEPAKVVVWAHNSHLGDARHTEMSLRGEINVGQLVRERYGRESTSIGFTTFAGSVTAAADWGGAAERKVVRHALEGSWERLFHELGMGNVFLDLRRLRTAWTRPTALLERAIGVIYRPETERESHYFDADLPWQFDGLLHYDRTRAVEPLERTAIWERGELPETYPSGV
jgi:erythromycin esterase-like protein